jgi:hypothetical protein
MEVSGLLHSLATLPPGKEHLVPTGIYEIISDKFNILKICTSGNYAYRKGLLKSKVKVKLSLCF